MDFSGKTVLVTGGSRGIGLAISQSFAEQGASVIILFRNNTGAAQAALSSLPGSGHRVLQCDVSNANETEAAISELSQQNISIDILVNNAGIGLYHSVENSDFEEWQNAWQETLAANLIGPANLCFLVGKKMIAAGGGRIVNVTSRGAFRGEPTKPAYGASKAALNSLTQSLAVALAPYKVFVGAVAPGFVNTELTADRLNSEEGIEIRSQSPFNRVAEPKEVAYAVMFLASKGAEFSTGTIIDVNGASYLRS